MKPNTILDLKNQEDRKQEQDQTVTFTTAEVNNSIPQGSAGKPVVNDTDGKMK